MTDPNVLAWLNRECEDLERKRRTGREEGVLRQVALDDFRRMYRFPLRCVLRGYVADVRLAPAVDDAGEARYLEFIPDGFSPAVHRVLGGILFQCPRELHPGSVLTVALELHDPETYALHPPGLLATLHDLTAAVAVEP